MSKEQEIQLQDVNQILYQQLELLAEKSKEEYTTSEELCNFSTEIRAIGSVINQSLIQ